MTENKKSYYAVIPANIRYDESLPPNAKLLYGEITALCNTEGYCWASNKYFAALYGVTDRTIQRWLEVLTERGYIEIQIFCKNESKEFENRLISITELPPDKNVTTPTTKMSPPLPTKMSPPPRQKCRREYYKLNITSNNTKEIYKEKSDKPTRTCFIPPTVEEVKAYCKERNNDVDAERFVNYYTSKGWKVGGDKMQDWKSAVRNWEKNDIPNKPGKKKSYLTGKTGESTFDAEAFAKWDFMNTYGKKETTNED